jgi:hypothetical protein
MNFLRQYSYAICILAMLALTSCTQSRKPTALFTCQDSAKLSWNNPVAFTNRSANSSKFYWNFGDEISTEQNPTHTFKKIGWQPISLSASNRGNSSLYKQSIFINPPFNYFSFNTLTLTKFPTKQQDGSDWDNDQLGDGPDIKFSIDNQASDTIGNLFFLNTLPATKGIAFQWGKAFYKYNLVISEVDGRVEHFVTSIPLDFYTFTKSPIPFSKEVTIGNDTVEVIISGLRYFP